jgi:hypothetical protein
MSGASSNIFRVLFLPFKLLSGFLGLFITPFNFIRNEFTTEKNYVATRTKFFKQKRMEYKLNDELG